MTLSGDGGGPPCARAEVQAASLLRVLGRGGTGTVWLVADAQHPGEQRALKVARANIDCVNAFLKRQSSGSSHLGDRLKRPL